MGIPEGKEVSVQLNIRSRLSWTIEEPFDPRQENKIFPPEFQRYLLHVKGRDELGKLGVDGTVI
jgi:hypothetical protein